MTFTQTSDKPYDRHQYKVVLNNEKIFIFDSWEEANQFWWNSPNKMNSHIEVIDRSETDSGRGFGS
jgi:hypothetical protein